MTGSSLVKIACICICLVSLSLLFLSAYQYLLTSPYIKLEQVVVTGVDEKTKRELLKISKLNLNLSLLAINIDKLKQRMEMHPWVKSIELEKRFPHTLIIRVEKEVPWAVTTLPELYYMNRAGDIFKEVGFSEEIDYPVITGISTKGNEMAGQLKSAAHVLDILESEKGAWSRKAISEIHFRDEGGLALYFRSLPVVIVTRCSDINIKISELKKVVEHLQKTGRIYMVKMINLNYRDGVVVSFKG